MLRGTAIHQPQKSAKPRIIVTSALMFGMRTGVPGCEPCAECFAQSNLTHLSAIGGVEFV
jgi:hypothetical protein